MIIRSKNFRLKLEEILEDKFSSESYNESEKYALKLIQKWNSNDDIFQHQSSGSTGVPKTIEISREQIIISAQSTIDFIDPDRILKESLLCLDPKHIGGAMVIYRSLIFDQNLTMLEPSSNPLKELDFKADFDLVSVVPMQFDKFSAEEINRFKVILIGGAPMPVSKAYYGARVYSTFGMTETVSHFALRKLDEEEFLTIGDVEIASSEDQSLKLRGSVTNNKWLETNDIIEQTSNHSFKWIGRRDFIINSGGVKINPETVENQLRNKVQSDFMIGSLPDKILGQKVILISEGRSQEIDLSHLDKYSRPKEFYFGRKLERTSNGKINRVSTIEKLMLAIS